ncbi:LolA family protein [Vibrio sp. WJH972]
MSRLIPYLLVSLFAFSSFESLADKDEEMPPELTSIISMVSSQPQQMGTFLQEKNISGLSQKLLSSGEYFIEAGELETNNGIVWQQNQPFDDLLVVKNQQLYTKSGDGLKLQNVPTNVVSLMTDIFSGLMTGNVTNLQNQFDVAVNDSDILTTDDAEWSLTLKPKSTPLDSIFELITLSGKDSELNSVRLLEVSGDSTNIELTSSSEVSDIAKWLRSIE